MNEIIAPSWLAIAKGEIGQNEIEGPKHNPRILEYHKTTKLKATSDECPWCSSFCNWIMKQAGYKGTDSATARSWLKWGVDLEEPAYGCVVVLKRGSGGHVGFYVGRKDGAIALLGGNQGNAVSVTWFNELTALGFRWPKENL